MKIEFTGRHIEVTPAIRSHVEDHFAKIENLFDGRHPKVHVIIEVERGRHRSEVVMNWRNEALTATSTNADMYQSLTSTIAKIEKQARKLKDKVIDKSHKARKVATVVAPSNNAVKMVAHPKIIKPKSISRKPMTVDEARLLLDEGDKQFVVYRQAKDGQVAVLYKREDNNYGLIVP